MKKIQVISLILSILWAGNVSIAGEFDPYVDNKLSLARCLEEGGNEYTLFLNSVIFSDSFKDGFIEPWMDVLERNQCQAQDILGLIKQQDGIRKSIRNAFLTCETKNMAQLKKAFYKNIAEIYYVRNVVDGGLVLSLPFNLLATRPLNEAVKRDKNQIYTEMFNKYTGGEKIPGDEFDPFFEYLEEKYEDREATYIVECPNNSWQAVAEKWDEFKSYFSDGIVKDIQKQGKNISSTAKRAYKEAATSETIKFLNSEESFGDYLSSFVSFSMNDLPPKQALSEIAENFNNNLPFSETDNFGDIAQPVAISQSSLLAANSQANRVAEIKALEGDLKSKFNVLYHTASDESISLFLNTIDGTRTKDIKDDGLIEIVNNSFQDLKRLEVGVDKINSRQCPGS